MSVDQLADALVNEYELPVDEARQDVRDFLDQLASLNAVESRATTV